MLYECFFLILNAFCVVQDTDDSQASMEIIANVAKLPENKYCADCGAMGMCGCAYPVLRILGITYLLRNTLCQANSRLIGRRPHVVVMEYRSVAMSQMCWRAPQPGRTDIKGVWLCVCSYTCLFIS